MSFPLPTRAQESRTAIARLYVTMRHLFNRGYYKPNGRSGDSLREALFTLKPEIYGSIMDPEKVELEGLIYIIDRLPQGIEECRFVQLLADEGYSNDGLEVIIPPKRRRNCYRLDANTMLIEVTRGRSEIYDILTHLTFMYLEANKIARNAHDHDGNLTHEWRKLEEIMQGGEGEPNGQHVPIEARHQAFSYLSSLLGRTYQETLAAHKRLEHVRDFDHGLFHTVYWLGKLSMEENEHEENERIIKFSSALRDRIGHHLHGEKWASNIQDLLMEKGWQDRPMHIISANLHSVRTSLYGYAALEEAGVRPADWSIYQTASELSSPEHADWNQIIEDYARKHGMYVLDDTAGTNIVVQLFDMEALRDMPLAPELGAKSIPEGKDAPLILVMDYAFGEQAYELMDELLKPYDMETNEMRNIQSVSIMGKAGILTGDKGDLMIPTAHVFEGTADNYPFENDLTAAPLAIQRRRADNLADGVGLALVSEVWRDLGY